MRAPPSHPSDTLLANAPRNFASVILDLLTSVPGCVVQSALASQEPITVSLDANLTDDPRQYGLQRLTKQQAGMGEHEGREESSDTTMH